MHRRGEPAVADLGTELRPTELRLWEHIHDGVRRHQALGYLTPRQFLDERQRRNPPRQFLYTDEGHTDEGTP